MNLFQLLKVDPCSDLDIVIDLVRLVLNVIRFGIPLVLIVLISIDMFKAMTTGDEKAQKGAQTKAIKRLIYAVVIFLVPTLVELIINLVPKVFSDVNTEDAANFWSCWNQ